MITRGGQRQRKHNIPIPFLVFAAMEWAGGFVRVADLVPTVLLRE